MNFNNICYYSFSETNSIKNYYMEIKIYNYTYYNLFNSFSNIYCNNYCYFSNIYCSYYCYFSNIYCSYYYNFYYFFDNSLINSKVEKNCMVFY